MILSFERKILLIECLVFGVLFIQLLISQYTKDWFHFTKNSDCSWKGNFEEIYSSDCYTHKSYNDADCHSTCLCCHEDNLASLTDLKGNTVCIYANFILVIICLFFNISINLYKIYFNFRFYWKLFSITYIITGIISCFLTGNSHPEKVELKTGYILRLSTILIFYFIGILHLFYACRLIWTGKDKVQDERQAEEMREAERPLRLNENSDGPGEVTIQ